MFYFISTSRCHVTEYSLAKPGEFSNFPNCASCKKKSEANKDNSLHMMLKHAWIFVLGHYLFLKAHSFSRAMLTENCSILGKDDVCRQISKILLVPSGSYCLLIMSIPTCFVNQNK